MTSKDYTVTITRQAPQTSLSTNADLSALTASTATGATGTFNARTLTPAFSASETSYTVTVANNQTHIKLTPTVDDTGKAALRVFRGSIIATVTSGSASSAIPLSVGSNAVRARVTAEDGTTTKDYTVTVIRQAGTGQLSAPSNVSYLPADASVAVSWTTVEDANRLVVQYCLTSAWTSGSGCSSPSHKLVNEIGATSTTVTGLSNGMSYSMRMRAEDTTNLRSASSYTSWAQVTPLAVPAAPTNLRVTTGDAQLTLSWTAPTGTLTGYDVHYTSATVGTVSNGAAVQTGASPSAANGWVAASRTSTDTTASQTITGLSNDTVHRVRVRAKASAGNGAWAFGSGTTLPMMNFSTFSYVADEGGTNDIAVELSKALAVATTVTLSIDTANSDAEETTDFTLSTKTLTFAAGETQALFTVSAVADMTTEGLEEFTVELVAANNAPYALGDTADATVSIFDASRTPGLIVRVGSGISDASPDGIDEGQSEDVAGVLSEAAPMGGATVTFTLGNTGTATENTDYTLSPKSITITEGETFNAEGTVTLKALHDAVDDHGETVVINASVTLSGSTYTATKTITIIQTAPTGLGVTPGAGKLDLAWTAPTAVTVHLYDVHYTSAPTSGQGAVADDAAASGNNPSTAWVEASRSLSPVALSHSLTGLDNGTAYRVRVRSTSFASNREPSGWIYGTGTTPVSTDATLSALVATTATAADGTYNTLDIGAFAAATENYTATVAGEQTHLMLTPTANEKHAVVKVGKQGTTLSTVTSGQASDAIALSLGANAITVEVTAQDTTTTKTYTVTVTRLLAAPTSLGITAGDGSLALAWTAPTGTVTGYDVHYTSALKTGATPVADDAAVQTGGVSAGWTAVSRGTENDPPTASQALSGLTNDTEYRVRVRAKNADGNGDWVHGAGTPQQTDTTGPSAPAFVPGAGDTVSNAGTNITLTFTEAVRKDNANADFTSQADLSAVLTLARTNAGGTAIPYSASINTDKTIITIDPTDDLADGTVYVGISNAYYDSNGNAGTAASATFTVATMSTNADLSGLTASTATSSGGPFNALAIGTFAASTTSYAATVANDQTYLKVTPTVAATGRAMVGVRKGSSGSFTAVTSGSASDEIALDEGANEITVRVTAGDTTTTKDYTVTVTRRALQPTVTLSVLSNPVQEGVTVTITATLSSPATETLNFPITVTRGSAEAEDLGTLPTRIRIASGQLRGTVDLATRKDDDEDDESFTVALDTANLPSGIAAGAVTAVGVAIVDMTAAADTPTVDLSISPRNAVRAGESVTITATLSEALSGAVTIPLTLKPDDDGTTSADYGTVADITIAAGETSGTATLATVADSDTEYESFRVLLGDLPAEVSRGDWWARVTIRPRGTPVVWLSAPATVNEGEGVTVTAHLSQAVSPTVRIPVTAQFGSGPATPHEIIITGGATSGVLAIVTREDDDSADDRLTVEIDTKRLTLVEPYIQREVLNRDRPNKVAITVIDRPALSSGRATAREGRDSAAEFTVRLSYEAANAVTVAYTTADAAGDWEGASPATAGADYTAVSGTLTFAVGQTEKTVSVPILDDVLDEGSEHFLLRLSNPQGAYVKTGHGELHGLITNEDPLQRMWLSRFGRTVGTQVTEAVAGRLEVAEPATHVTVAGQRLDLTREDTGQALAETVAGIAQLFAAPSGPAPGGAAPGGFALHSGPAHGGLTPRNGLADGRLDARSGPADSGFDARSGSADSGLAADGQFDARNGLADGGLAKDGGFGARGAPADIGLGVPVGSGAYGVTSRDIQLGSSFHVGLGRAGGGLRLSAWGEVALAHFDGAETDDAGRTQLGGEVLTRVLGLDADFGRVLAGVAVSLSDGEGAFDNPGVDIGNAGHLSSTLTAVSPYVRVNLTESLSAWGLAGAGMGEMSIRFDDEAMPGVSTGLSMRMGAAGARGVLLSQDGSGVMDLALKADALFVRTRAEQAAGSIGTEADASRLRLLLKGGRRFSLPHNATLHPSLELGVRHDGGDAETGSGVELGGALTFASVFGLSVEASARRLVAHADSDYEEWGASATVHYDPGEPGKGLSLSLAPTIGAAASGTERLWGAAEARGLAPGAGLSAPGGPGHTGMTLIGQLGYGIESYRLRGLIKPTLGYAGQHGGGATLRFGADYAADPQWLGLDLAIGFGLQRGETLEGADWSGELRVTMRW